MTQLKQRGQFNSKLNIMEERFQKVAFNLEGILEHLTQKINTIFSTALLRKPHNLT